MKTRLAPTEEAEVPAQDDGCYLCSDSPLAQHLASAQHQPAAFCGACGRPIPTVVVRQAPSTEARSDK